LFILFLAAHLRSEQWRWRPSPECIGRCPAITLAIKTESLTKTYGQDSDGKAVGLLGLSLEVEPSQIYGLVGPNGSGKTTTLKLLLGLIFPTSGTATVLGDPIGSADYKERIGYVPEGPYFYDHLNAIELLAFYGSLFGIYGKEIEKRTQELLELVGMWTRRHIRVRNYSRGMLQRVGVAQSLLNDPDLVFMDEPTAGLDPPAQMQMRDIILQVRQRGKTVFLCSHLLKEMEPLCDNIAILNRGKVVESGTMRDVLVGQEGFFRVSAEQVGKDLEQKIAATAKKFTHSGGLLEAQFANQTTAAHAVETLSQGGALVTHMGPDRRSLEEVFISAVKGEQ
jgi:ABC-2 type transport system ATP-binding protein